MRKTTVFGLVLIGLLLANPALFAAPYQEEETGRAELGKAVASVKVSLEQGLATVARAGKPLSARFEVEDGRLQLSVYRVRDNQFAEVVVDPETGAVAEEDPITSGGSYTIAQARNAAMSRTKQTLEGVVTQVLKTNPGYKAVAVVPSLKAGRPVAEVTLTRPDEGKWKTVTKTLD